MNTPRTLFEKIWHSHLVQEPATDGLPATLAIDLHLLHEVTTPQAFAELEARGLKVRRPHQCLATMDHSTPTEPGLTLAGLAARDPAGAAQLERLAENCRRHGIPLLPLGDHRQGIVHVIGPELGLTQPGMIIVCGDSHTSTHGAFGALAFGIGTSEVGHVLATQCLLQKRPKTFAIDVDGRLAPGVTAKDLILEIIATLGVDGGTGAVFEYRGEAIRALDMDGRMTVCNMSIEGGARAGLIAPDEVTFDYLKGRPGAPRGEVWDAAIECWRRLPSDPGVLFDRHACFDARRVAPRLTFGTNPGQSIAVDGMIPEGAGLDRALNYMGFAAGRPLLGQKIDVVFLGSCTNSRLTDLRAAASLLKGRRVAANVLMLVVPGSERVRRQAEEEGLAQIFVDAGAEWRRAGCSMCLAMNGDRLAPGQLAVSTSNRNFEGRQGPGGRTLLASPLTAAAAAIAGAIADPRDLIPNEVFV